MKFKSWLNIKEMTEREAEVILGSRKGDPNLLNAYRQAAIKAHPDKGGNTEDIKKVNAAFEILSGKKQPTKEIKPFWGSKSYDNDSYCKYIIEEKSKQKGSVQTYSFLVWDGYFFRGTLVARSNPESFDFAGMIVEKWNNSLRDKDEDTKAVFVSLLNEMLLIRLDGKDVSQQNRTFNMDQINIDPNIDQKFIKMLRKSLYNQ